MGIDQSIPPGKEREFNDLCFGLRFQFSSQLISSNQGLDTYVSQFTTGTIELKAASIVASETRNGDIKPMTALSPII